MQILMSEAAHARVADRIGALGAAVDVVTIDAGGTLKRGGVPVEAADPEGYWISLDLYPAGMLPLVFEQMMRGSAGKWAQLFTAGVDNPLFRSVMAKGVRLSKSNAQAPAIAEYVTAHAFSLLHPIAGQARAQAAREWRPIRFREIADSRWVLVGFGAIGTEIARRLAPFGVHPTVVRRTLKPTPLAAEVRATGELRSVLPGADVVVLACALNDETRGLADAAFFAALKPGAILINIGRGALVDEAALKAGLDRNQPGTAVLDVFTTEPLPTDAWFWDHPQVRLTAHGSNAGNGVLARGDELFLENLRRYRAGESLLNEATAGEVGL